jgi:hypothetical protein
VERDTNHSHESPATEVGRIDDLCKKFESAWLSGTRKLSMSESRALGLESFHSSRGGGVMCRTVVGILVLLLALPAARSDDKPKDKPSTAQEQYKALLKEHQDAMRAFDQEYMKAKTDEERAKVIQEKYPKPDKLAAKFLELAEKNPKDTVAFEALSWILTNDRNAGGKDGPADKAVALLLRDHLQSDKLAGLCQNLYYRHGKASLDLLRGIVDNSPGGDVEAEACLALAQRLGTMAQAIRLLKEQPEQAKGYERILGKEQVEEMRKADVAKAEAESARYFKEFGEKYAAKMKPDRLTHVCRVLTVVGGTGGETLLLALLEKDERREVQGAACLSLAQSLKGRAERLPEAKAVDAEKLRKQSEEMFERAADKYADFDASVDVTAEDWRKCHHCRRVSDRSAQDLAPPQPFQGRRRFPGQRRLGGVHVGRGARLVARRTNNHVRGPCGRLPRQLSSD